jgi:phosphodiesterase/alkaline phosphatase D-like protein
MMGGGLRSSPVWAAAPSYDGTITQSILILVHGSAGASGELSLVKEPLENWGYPVEVFDYTEYYDLLGSGNHWYLHDQGGGHGDLDLVVDGDMQYSVIIFDPGNGLAYTDVETSSRAVRQMFEEYPFLGLARMENGYTRDGTMDNLFQIDNSGQAADNLTVSNPMGIWALEPLVGYSHSYGGAQAVHISGKTSNVTVLESFDDLAPALTLTSYASGAHAVYFAFKDWGYAEHLAMLVRLIQEYSGMPYIRPYYSLEVDDCGAPAVNGYDITNEDYIALVNWAMSNLGGYPTFAFREKYLDPNPPANIFVYGLNPTTYWSDNVYFNPDSVALMAALEAYDDYVVASHGYQHDRDWWQWTATGLAVDPYGDEDSDGLLNWQDDDLGGVGVNNNDNPNLTIVSYGAFVEPDLDLQERWFHRMREVFDLYGYSDAQVLIAPKYEYLDGYTNSLASQYGFEVISARASNQGFNMTLGWVNGTYAPGRVSPSSVGTDVDVALTSAEQAVYSINFMGYIGKQPLCLVTNHIWQFAEGDTGGYELRDSYLSSYGVMTEAGFTLVSTQTATNKNIGWLWTDMTSVLNSSGSTSLTLNSSTFQDGAARHELDIVMPSSIQEVQVGSNYWIYVDNNTLFYGKQSNSSETLEVLSGTYNSSLPRISSVSTLATDVLNAIYDPTSGKISLMLDGTFSTTLDISNFRRPFLQGTTSIGSDGNSALTIGLAGLASTESVNMSIVPSSDSVGVAVQNWNTSGDYLRQWTESSTSPGTSTMHTMGDLTPGKYYSIWYTKDGGSKTLWQTLQANGSGQISFNYDQGYSTVSYELRAAPAVTTNDASNLATTSAVLNGNLTSMGAADNVTVSFEWGTAAGGPYPNPTAGQAKAITGAFSVDLAVGSLTPGTTYYYRAVADGDGPPVYGAEKPFTTLTTAPAVTTNDASNLTTTSATMNGNLTSLGTADNVTVSFEWGTTTSYGSETTPVSRDATGGFTANLTGLSAKTTYHFRAKAVGDGTVWGDHVTFTTSTVLPSVTTSDATNVANTSATLNGNLTSLGTAAIVTVSFEYVTKSGGSYTPVAVVVVGVKDSTGAFSADLSGLTPGTEYYYRAKAVGDGAAQYGAEKSFTTSVTPPTVTPPTVTTSSATSLTTTSARLNANLVSLGTKSSVTVSFLWKVSGGTYTETTGQAKTAAGALFADLSGLTQETTYYYKVKVVGDGDPVYGEEKSFTTADGAPPVISVVDSSDITTSGTTVTWTTNEAATSQVEYGLTEEYGSISTVDAGLVNSHSVELTGLKAGKTYHYRVISKDAANNQAVSGDNTFTTTAGSGGMPFWAWVLIALGVVGVLGAAAYLIRGRLAKQ